MRRTRFALTAPGCAVLLAAICSDTTAAAPPGAWAKDAPGVARLLRDLERDDEGGRSVTAAALRSSVQTAPPRFAQRALDALAGGNPRDALDAQRALALLPAPPVAALDRLQRSESSVARAYARLRRSVVKTDRGRPRPTTEQLDSALRTVGPTLVSLLSRPERDLSGADPEFATYYRDELLQRLNRPGHGVEHEDAVLIDLDDDPEPELCVAAAWRSSAYLHDLRFIAVFDQRPGGAWRIVSFQKISGVIDDAFVIDLDGDGDMEFVVTWTFPSGHPVFALSILSRTGDVLTTHVVRSYYRPVTLLAADDVGPPTIVAWRDGPSNHVGAVDGELLRWSERGFVSNGFVAIPW